MKRSKSMYMQRFIKCMQSYIQSQDLKLPIYDPAKIKNNDNNLSKWFVINKRRKTVILLIGFSIFGLVSIVTLIVFAFIYPSFVNDEPTINTMKNQRGLKGNTATFISDLNKAYNKGNLFLRAMEFGANNEHYRGNISRYVEENWKKKYQGFLPMISAVHRCPADQRTHVYDFGYGFVKMIFNQDVEGIFSHEVGEHDLNFINPGGIFETVYQDQERFPVQDWDFNTHEVCNPNSKNFKSEVERILRTLDQGNGKIYTHIDQVPQIIVNQVYESAMYTQFLQWPWTFYKNMAGVKVYVNDHIKYFSKSNPVGTDFNFGEGVISVNMNKEDIAKNIPIAITWYPEMWHDVLSTDGLPRFYPHEKNMLESIAKDLRLAVLKNFPNIKDEPQNFPIVWMDLTQNSTFNEYPSQGQFLSKLNEQYKKGQLYLHATKYDGINYILERNGKRKLQLFKKEAILISTLRRDSSAEHQYPPGNVFIIFNPDDVTIKLYAFGHWNYSQPFVDNVVSVFSDFSPNTEIAMYKTYKSGISSWLQEHNYANKKGEDLRHMKISYFDNPEDVEKKYSNGEAIIEVGMDQKDIEKKIAIGIVWDSSKEIKSDMIKQFREEAIKVRATLLNGFKKNDNPQNLPIVWLDTSTADNSERWTS